ncbi:hypothetical protein ACIP23_20850 [Streptomyces sp. NPDC089733]|uniref:hypothetical protein n=1 Tax=Streptomyces sp. NPDC089733 TaxID=3365918 RepID=UPI00381298C0
MPAYASHGADGGGPVWGAPSQPYAPEGPRKRGMGGLVAAVAGEADKALPSVVTIV